MINFGSNELDQAVTELQTAGAVPDATQRAEGVLTSLFNVVPRIYGEIKAWSIKVVAAVQDISIKVAGIQQKMDAGDAVFTQTSTEIKKQVEDLHQKLQAVDQSRDQQLEKLKQALEAKLMTGNQTFQTVIDAAKQSQWWECLFFVAPLGPKDASSKLVR